MADNEVGNAFVTIGGKTEALKKAFSDSESLTRNTLGRMGREIGGFATKFGGKLGIGIGGGFAVGAAVAIKAGVSLQGSLADVGQRAGELGVKFQEQLGIINQFFGVWRKLTPLSREQALAMGALGLQYGFAGKSLKSLLEASAGAAEGFTTPLKAMEQGINALVRGGDLLDLGIRTTGPTSEDVFRDFLRTGGRRGQAARARGELRPGKEFEAIGERVKDVAGVAGGVLFDVAESIQQSLDIVSGPKKLPTKPGGVLTDIERFRGEQGLDARKRRRDLERQFGFDEATPLDKITERISRFFGGDVAGLTGSEQRAQREAERFNDRAGRESGVSGPERAVRGTVAGGGGGTESEKLSSALDKLKAAVDANTGAVKGLTSIRPLVAEHP